jgi:mRNA interferase MazF
VRRGDIYIAAASGSYTGNPRPVAVIQDDRFDAAASLTVAPFTNSDFEAPLFRIPVQPSTSTGLTETSHLMIDKLTSIPHTSLSRQIGRLSDADLVNTIVRYWYFSDVRVDEVGRGTSHHAAVHLLHLRAVGDLPIHGRHLHDSSSS